MSYILDALKKAAEQRGEGAPGFRRVVSAPAAPVHNRGTWTRIGVIALCAVAAGAVTFAAFRRAHVTVVAPQPAVATPEAAAVAPQSAGVGRAPAEAPRAPVSAPPRVVAPVISVPREEAPRPRTAPAARPVVAVTPRPDTPVAAVTPLSAPTAPTATSAPVPVAGGDAKL